jgi:hypothetical protein
MREKPPPTNHPAEYGSRGLSWPATILSYIPVPGGLVPGRPSGKQEVQAVTNKSHTEEIVFFQYKYFDILYPPCSNHRALIRVSPHVEFLIFG